MKPPNTVIERGMGGPVCGECQRVLPVAGALNRVCIQCYPQLEFVELLGGSLGAENSRELDVLAELMKKKQMTARGVIRHMFRLGQMVDLFTAQGYEVVFRKGDDEVDPFDRGPKMAPMPPQFDETHSGKPTMHDGWATSPFNREREQKDVYCERGCGQFAHHPPTGECPNES
jgi:hypothetical protein